MANHPHGPKRTPVCKLGEAKAGATRRASTLHGLLSGSPLRSLAFERAPVRGLVREVEL